MVHEAAVAHRRCKGMLPPAWQASLRSDRAVYLDVEPIVQAHLARSPDCWQPSIQSELKQQAIADIRLEHDRTSVTPTCDACGANATSLRRCGGCKVKQYVSGGWEDGRMRVWTSCRLGMHTLDDPNPVLSPAASTPQCSRTCQVRDWKEGGDRAQCVALAAARERGSSG